MLLTSSVFLYLDNVKYIPYLMYSLHYLSISSIYSHNLSCEKKRYLFKWPKIMLSFLTLIFFSGGELPVDKRCEFSSFLWVWSILGPESTDVIFCFHFLSSPFILHSFPLCSFHVAFMSFHFAFILLSCPFMFRRYVSKIQVFESLYAQAGQVGISPNARVFFHILLLLLSFSYRFGGLCRLPSSGVMNMCIYIYIYIYHEHVHI